MSNPTIPRELLGKIIDEVFDGAIEDASVIEEIYAAIKRYESPPPLPHVVGTEAVIRKAGQVAIDALIDRWSGTMVMSNDDMADYMTSIVDACVRDALHAAEGSEG